MKILIPPQLFYKLFGALFVFLIIVEVLLRLIYGFGSMVLYSEDQHFEYIATANQRTTRFFNEISYNEWSMRSRPLVASDTFYVLGFGDSVINGGTLTTQDSLATTIVEDQMRQKENKRFRFLNISSGSWGPDNSAAYLKKYGDFGSKLIVLFVSSHDAYDNITFEKVVGVHESYPDTQYLLAITEVLDRYFIKKYWGSYFIFKPKTTDNIMINKNGNGFNSGFESFYQYSLKKKIPLLICLHAEKVEVKNNIFNAQGQEIISFCNLRNISLLNGIDLGEDSTLYRDNIHINSKGQRFWAAKINNHILNLALF